RAGSCRRGAPAPRPMRPPPRGARGWRAAWGPRARRTWRRGAGWRSSITFRFHNHMVIHSAAVVKCPRARRLRPRFAFVLPGVRHFAGRGSRLLPEDENPMRFQILKRMLAIAGVAIAILLPISMIKGKIAERQARAEAVVAQFAAETSGAQVIAGPFLALSCEESVVQERQVLRAGKADTVREPVMRACETAYFSPRTFAATASAPVESLHRGLYAIRLYHADISMQGEL